MNIVMGHSDAPFSMFGIGVKRGLEAAQLIKKKNIQPQNHILIHYSYILLCCFHKVYKLPLGP